jgi:hypothetical protein
MEEIIRHGLQFRLCKLAKYKDHNDPRSCYQIHHDCGGDPAKYPKYVGCNNTAEESDQHDDDDDEPEDSEQAADGEPSGSNEEDDSSEEDDGSSEDSECEDDMIEPSGVATRSLRRESDACGPARRSRRLAAR